MGEIIGGETGYSTWGKLRQLTGTTNPGTPFVASTLHNTEYAAGNVWLKTIEGNGFVRLSRFASPGASLNFYGSDDPEIQDFFNSFGFVEPHEDTLLGKTVTTAGGAFTIGADAFLPTAYQEVAESNEPPIVSVELFTFLT